MANKDITRDDTVLQTWFERDRRHVCLSRKDPDGMAGGTIVEWWDGAVTEAVEDGFLDPRDWHGSAFAYARENGLLDPSAAPATISETPRGVVAASAAKGVYMGWRDGGSAIWSSDATPDELARGAWAFDGEDEARRTMEADGEDPEDVTYAVAELDVTPPSRRDPSRASLESCVLAGVELPTAAPAP